jgi:hypothetical protein
LNLHDRAAIPYLYLIAYVTFIIKQAVFAKLVFYEIKSKTP